MPPKTTTDNLSSIIALVAAVRAPALVAWVSYFLISRGLPPSIPPLSFTCFSTTFMTGSVKYIPAIAAGPLHTLKAPIFTGSLLGVGVGVAVPVCVGVAVGVAVDVGGEGK